MFKTISNIPLLYFPATLLFILSCVLFMATNLLKAWVVELEPWLESVSQPKPHVRQAKQNRNRILHILGQNPTGQKPIGRGTKSHGDKSPGGQYPSETKAQGDKSPTKPHRDKNPWRTISKYPRGTTSQDLCICIRGLCLLYRGFAENFVPLGYCPLGYCPPWVFVPVGFCPCGVLSPWAFVSLGYCPPGLLSPWDFVPLGFCPPWILSAWILSYGFLSSGVLS